MKYRSRGKILSAACLLGGSLLLAACGSDDSTTSTSSGGTPPAASTSTVSGVAATGAPIAGGSIVLHCQNSWNEGTTTNSNGEWSMVVPSANLPCAIKASTAGAGSQSFYSFTTGSGSSIVTNITPLTSLALAKTGFTPNDAWFNALNNAGLQSLASNIAAAVTALQSALQTAGYTLPAGFNPFSVAFTATAGNGYDDLLEEIKAALADASTDLPTLLASFASGGSLPDAPDEEPGEEPGSTDDCSSEGGENKLGFLNAPDDFCSFTKQSSNMTMTDYYVFQSASGTHGITDVKIETSGSTVTKITIEDNEYAYACGTPFAACSGATVTVDGTARLFNLTSVQLTAFSDSSKKITASGELIHGTPSTGGGGDSGVASDTIATPTLETSEFGIRFASNGTIGGSTESGTTRFWSGNGEVVPGTGDNAGLLRDAYLNIFGDSFLSFGLVYLSNQTGTYTCGGNSSTLNISLTYGSGKSYSSIGTSGVSGFSCSITVTNKGTISGSNYTGAVEGTFKARLFKTGAPVSLANSIVASGSFRLGH